MSDLSSPSNPSTHESNVDARLIGSEEDRWTEYYNWIKDSADNNDEKHKQYFEGATHYERMHERLGVALVILSAIISGSLLETFGGESDVWQKRGTALLSIAATVIAGIQGLVKPAERARRLRATARQYLDLTGQSMAVWFPLEFGNEPHRVTDALVKDWLQLERRDRSIAAHAPSLPKRVLRARNKGDAVKRDSCGAQAP